MSSAPTRKRPSVLFGLWCLTAVLASATADAETDGKCHRGQARRARQEPDALRFEREIRVFPALAQTYTKNHQRPDAEAFFGESVAEVADSCREERSDERKEADASDTVSPLPARGRFERLFEQQKDFQVWRGKSGQY